MDIVRARPTSWFSPRFRTAMLAVAGIAAALTLTTWLRKTASAGDALLIDRTAVFTAKVRRGDLVRQAPVQGALVPEHIEWLSATSAGQVSRIEVKAGAEVDAGDVILVLTNADLELAALEAERAAATAESALVQLDVRTDADAKLVATSLVGLRADAADAQRHADAAARLHPEGLMSSLDADEAKSKARGLSARVDSEAARLSLLEGGRPKQLVAQRAELTRLKEIATFARRRLDGLVVKAPIKGVVQDVPPELGQWMQVGSVLAKIAEPGRLKADVRVGESDAKDLRRGLPVRFDVPGGEIRGKVSRVDPAVLHGSVRLEVALDDPMPRGARSDQSVTGFVEVEKLENVLAVTRPAGALEHMDVRVFRVDGDGASRSTIRAGRGSAREIEIESGAREGDELVISEIPGAEAASRIRFK
jgi:multidrug resistance efflux pump